jgi:hypothetical protein
MLRGRAVFFASLPGFTANEAGWYNSTRFFYYFYNELQKGML